MNINDVIRRVGEIGVVPVVRAASVDEANRAVEAIRAGGIPIIEITMTIPDAISVMRHVASEYSSDVLLGAGTVVSADQAKACIDAGAEFLVSPGLSIPVISAARASGRLAIPGALTPTELMAAQDQGAELVKIFPCGSVGGPKYLKALRAPFPNAALIPTGGVSVANAAEFIAAGAFALGIGAELCSVAALREGNLASITQAAHDLLQVVRSARQSRHVSGGKFLVSSPGVSAGACLHGRFFLFSHAVSAESARQRTISASRADMIFFCTVARELHRNNSPASIWVRLGIIT
jgi:2-dehydro-3-deoxyphosphogluconate aldolase / (4S)-4-hydroxy-2-oxoglutarate aldolase